MAAEVEVTTAGGAVVAETAEVVMVEAVMAMAAVATPTNTRTGAESRECRDAISVMVR